MTESPAPGPERRRSLRTRVLIGLLAMGIITAFVLFWFQPQRLFIDDRVEEAVPVAAPASGEDSSGTATTEASASSERTPTQPIELARGEFVSLDHATSGTARVLDVGEGRHLVRLEGFQTENGPDLYVYLTTSRADSEQGSFDDDFVNLGRLKGNQGNQNYDVASDVDLTRYKTVVIWCDRFNSPFGAADLSDA